MEEQVGQLWDRMVTRLARTGYPQAAVSLGEVARPVGVMFRALGGDGALRVESVEASEYRGRRGWLQRLAGSHQQVELAWRDEQSLRLPPQVDLYPDRELNRFLYFWLAAMSAADSDHTLPWIRHNQALTLTTLKRCPGLAERYRDLVAAELARRPDPDGMSAEAAAQERAIRAALAEPGSIDHLPPAKILPNPVHLWLHPSPPGAGDAGGSKPDDEDTTSGGPQKDARDGRRRRSERTEMTKRDGGLATVRTDSILGWGEFSRVDRGQEEEMPDDPNTLADDLEVVSVSQDARPVSSRVRFDLDLPAAGQDDIPIGEGILLPEWDYRKGQLRPEHCRVQPMIAAKAPPIPLPPRLNPLARRLRRHFQALAPSRIWHRAQPDGSEIDLDAYTQFVAERAAGRADANGALYREMRQGGRDLACLLLADLSLSTDAWVNNDARIIDVIRDSLFLFSEALEATGDRFALHGFSSRRRDHVRFNLLKDFDERYSARVRGRLAAIRPGYYTRMGAAIRHATALLEPQPASRRLLLLLTDGKPNDLDQYEGRYGVEDTRMALIEAKRRGLRPFCVTIDDRAGDYLPHLFGSGGYVVIRRPSELPRQLPLLYAQLTSG